MIDEDAQQLLKYDDAIHDLRSRLDTVLDENKGLKDNYEAVKTERDGHRKMIDSMQDQLNVLHKKYHKLDSDLQAEIDKKNSMREDTQKLNLDYSEIKAVLKKRENEIDGRF